MKGIVFNLLEEIVRDEYGEDTWDALLETASLDGVYTSLGNYPDDDLGRLVQAASAALGIAPQDVVRWVGKKALPRLFDRYPHFFSAHNNTRSFVLTLNSIIHPEVRKLYPGADPPDFVFDTSRDDILVMRYKSARKLCMLAMGLIDGAAEHYGESAQIAQTSCMHRGEPECVFEIKFAALSASRQKAA